MRVIASRACEAERHGRSAAVAVTAVVAADRLPVLGEAALGVGWCECTHHHQGCAQADQEDAPAAGVRGPVALRDGVLKGIGHGCDGGLGGSGLVLHRI